MKELLDKKNNENTLEMGLLEPKLLLLQPVPDRLLRFTNTMVVRLLVPQLLCFWDREMGIRRFKMSQSWLFLLIFICFPWISAAGIVKKPSIYFQISIEVDLENFCNCYCFCGEVDF